MSEYLPDVYTDSREAYPKGGQALDDLGAAAGDAGLLEERSRRLIKLGIAVGGLVEGAVRSNARKVLELGTTSEKIRLCCIPGDHYNLVSQSNRRADLDRRSTWKPRPSCAPRHGCLVDSIV